MAPGGFGANASTEFGWVLFVKQGEGADKKMFHETRKNIIIPFIYDLHKVYLKFDASLGARPDSDDLATTIYCDGDNSQLEMVTSEEGTVIYAEHNTMACKHNASETAINQSMDGCKVFPAQKKMNRSTNCEHIPKRYHLLKSSFVEGLKGLKEEGRRKAEAMEGRSAH